jgi:hypothetical protein
LGIFGPLFRSVDTAPAGPGTLPMPGEAGRARNRAWNARATQAFDGIQAYAREIFASIGVVLDSAISGLKYLSTDLWA